MIVKARAIGFMTKSSFETNLHHPKVKRPEANKVFNRIFILDWRFVTEPFTAKMAVRLWPELTAAALRDGGLDVTPFLSYEAQDRLLVGVTQSLKLYAKDGEESGDCLSSIKDYT